MFDACGSLSSERIIEFVQNHNEAIGSVFHVLLFDYPSSFIAVLGIMESYFIFIRKSNCGFFASAVLVCIIAYFFAVIHIYFGKSYYSIEGDQFHIEYPSTRPLSIDRIAQIASSAVRAVVYPFCEAPESPIRHVLIALAVISASFCHHYLDGFWLSYFAVHVAFFAPLVLRSLAVI